jgi:hypothetical protein
MPWQHITMDIHEGEPEARKPDRLVSDAGEDSA